MKGFSLSERFRLELHWDSVVYEQPGKCRVNNTYFTGPVLQIAQKMNSNDSIMLDFFSQYLYLVKGVYVAKFTWGEVKYVDNDLKIILSDTFIEHDTELNNVPALVDSDWLMIDTKGHDVRNHPHMLVYKTFVMNEDKDLYRFGK